MVDLTSGLSLNRQLHLLPAPKSTYYRSTIGRPDPDAFLKQQLGEIYAEFPH